MTLVHFDMRSLANFALTGAALAGLLFLSAGAGADRSAERTAATATTATATDAGPADTHPDDQGWG